MPMKSVNFQLALFNKKLNFDAVSAKEKISKKPEQMPSVCTLSALLLMLANEMSWVYWF